VCFPPPLPCLRFPSSLKTIKEIKKNESVGDLSPLPFVSLATNCVVWDCYGFLNNDMTVLLPNLTGAMAVNPIFVCPSPPPPPPPPTRAHPARSPPAAPPPPLTRVGLVQAPRSASTTRTST
jgi:hypothetical protein